MLILFSKLRILIIFFLKIQEFDLEGSENCEFDSLNIYNGPDQVIFLFLPGVDINRDQKNFC